MRVLQQLITYFWERGSLTADQAHYFIEHGFVRAEDLLGYEPRVKEDEEDRDWPVWDAAPNKIDVILPDTLDLVESALTGQTEGKRKRRKAAPKVADITPKQL